MNGRRAKAERRAGIRSGRAPEPRRVEPTKTQALALDDAAKRRARMKTPAKPAYARARA